MKKACKSNLIAKASLDFRYWLNNVHEHVCANHLQKGRLPMISAILNDYIMFELIYIQ